jgi:RNA polymerase sigma-70 factor (ECF subfamily)
MSAQPRPEEIPRSATGEPSDRWLLWRFREGDQDAGTRLYVRYAKRLNSLVEKQCSAELMRWLEAEDIVQSVFLSFFRRARQGYYDVPDGEELWKLLLVLALHKIRDKFSYYHAARRDAHRTLGGEGGRRRLESQADAERSQLNHLQLAVREILEELPPRCRVMVELRVEGYEVAEVALKTGRSRRTVERILQEARLKLGELLR